MWRESRTQHLWRGDDGRRLSRRDSREGGKALSRSIVLFLPPPHNPTPIPPHPLPILSAREGQRDAKETISQLRIEGRGRGKKPLLLYTLRSRREEAFLQPLPLSLPRQGKSFPLVDFWGWGLPPLPPSVFAKKWALGANMTNPVWTKKNGEENVVGRETQRETGCFKEVPTHAPY